MKNVPLIIAVFVIGAMLAIIFVPYTSPQIAIEKIDISKDQMIEQILGPTARVVTEHTTGSGVVIYRSDDIYHVITNYHVLEYSISVQQPEVDGILGTVEWHDPPVTIQTAEIGQIPGSYVAKIIGLEPRFDLALLEFTSDKNLPVAKLVNNDIINSVELFDEIYSSGCQFGRSPIVQKGMVNGFTPKDGILFIVTSAPLAPGGSGGGVFIEHEGDYYVLSISREIGVDMMGRVYAHYAMSIVPQIVHEFLCQYSCEIEGLACDDY